MERKTKEIKIGDYLEIETDYDCGDKLIPIDKINSFLAEAKGNGAIDIKIDGNVDYDNSIVYVELQPIKIEIESDEDFEKREKQEKVLQEERIDRAKKVRKKEYEKLRDEFGDGK